MCGFLCFPGHRQERETYGMTYFQKPCKRLMPPIHTEFLQLNMIKRQKVGKGFRHFSKEDSQMAIKYIKKYLLSLNIGEIPVTFTMKYHLISIRMLSQCR